VKQHAAKRLPQTRPSAPVAPKLGEHDGVVFQWERLPKIIREVLPLLEADWRENGLDHEKLPLNVNLQQYLDYDLIGMLRIVTAREDDLLVGYMFAYCHPHIDHVGIGWAIITWYWLFPEYRGGGVGNAMLEAMETHLRASQVTVIEASEKVAHKHGLFERRGYVDTDVIKRKILED
jgi:GNAT superfamily N-acetyltransferase